MPKPSIAKLFSIVMALIVGISLNGLLLLMVFLFGGMGGAFYIVAVLFLSHMLLNIGILVYHKRELSEADMRFIRFGPLIAIWEVLKICG